MRLRRALAAHSLSVRRCLPKSALALTVSTLLLSACGGGGGGHNRNLEEAFAVIGQGDFKEERAYGGGSGPSAATFNGPIGNVATDGTALAVVDKANNRVLIYPTIPTSNGAAASVVVGQADMTSRTTVDTPTRSSLLSPTSAFISGSGKLVVTDQGNNRVLIWNSIPTVNNQPADRVIGQPDFTSGRVNVGGDPSQEATDQHKNGSATGLNGPTEAIITSNNRLVVADTANNRVLIWLALPTADGQAADRVLGQIDFIPTDDDDDEASMWGPQGVWSDGGSLLVADTSNNRILYWTSFPQNTHVAANYVVGQTDFDRHQAGLSAVGLRTPQRVSSDGARFYVADTGNNRVLRFDSMPASNGQNANFVYGQDNDSFSAATPNDKDQDGERDDDPSDKTVNIPSGAYVSNNTLYVTDQGNNRVLVFDPYATP